MIPMRRKPTSPGEILQEEFLRPIGLTQKVINRIVNGRSAVTAEMAVLLAASFDTSAEFWMNAQQAVDLHAARGRTKRLPRAIRTG
jgi:antitoxin HigA-1